MSPAPESLTLGQLQHWFLARVAADPAIAAPEREVAELIRPSATMSPEERVGVYAEMYFLRLREALADDFPGVAALLGDERFSNLVVAYLQRFPPRSYTLAHLGRSLPSFLSAQTEYGGAAAAELAGLELAITSAFDAAEATPLAATDLTEVEAEEWSLARLRITPGLELVASRFDIELVLDAVAAGSEVTPPSPGQSFTVVWRRELTVYRRRLTPQMYLTLAGLVAGESIASALESALASFSGAAEELEAQVFQWFGEWLSEGFFTALVLPSREIVAAARRPPIAGK